jgi:hypothetical protein
LYFFKWTSAQNFAVTRLTLLPLLTCGYIGDMFTNARLFREASQTALVFELAATAPEWRLA